MLIKSSRNIHNKSFTYNFYKNIKEIKVNFKKEKHKENNNNNIFAKGYPEDEIYKKIKQIQKWWKSINKIILIQKNVRAYLEWKKIIKILLFIKMIYKLFFKLFIDKIKYYKISKRKTLNNFENNNNMKKIKKFESSLIFNKIKKSKNNNSILNNSRNNNILKKKIETSIKTRNEFKSFQTNNTLNSLNTINTINKENTKCALLKNYNNNNNYNTINNKNKTSKYKKISNNITNKEKLKAYNNIFNIYNNVKKFYGNKNNNKKKKNKKNINERIIINKNNNINKNNSINVNININNNFKTIRNTKSPKNKDSIINLLKLKNSFTFWREYINKKNIIKAFKMINNDYYIIKNRIKEKESHKKTLSITTKKINLSNSVISQRLINITPKKLNQELINNYISKNNDAINKEKSNIIIINNNKEKSKLKETNNIEEKIISFKNIKSPFKYINNQNNFNSTLNIFHRKQNSIYQNNTSNNILCQTESNLNYPYNHIRANSIAVQKDINILSSQDMSCKDYIYKSKINSPKLIYKRKLLIPKRMRNNCLNINERNMTLYDDFNDLNHKDYYKNKVNLRINSIYGGRILNNSFGRKNNKIEEREICFTPNKNSNLKNNKKISVNIVENYLKRGINRDEIENYNYNNYLDNMGIKSKQINFL